jgi:hypothetical protein
MVVNYVSAIAKQLRICTYLHLLIPTFEDPANHGSRMNTQRNVVAHFNPSRKLGLSCKRSPFLNQCTVCFALFPSLIINLVTTLIINCPWHTVHLEGNQLIKLRKRRNKMNYMHSLKSSTSQFLYRLLPISHPRRSAQLKNFRTASNVTGRQLWRNWWNQSRGIHKSRCMQCGQYVRGRGIR